MDITIWIFAAIAFILLELLTSSFFLVWFGIASAVAAILNYLGFSIYVQFTAFAAISMILVLSTRKFADKITKEPDKKAISDRLIGKNARIIKEMGNNNFIVTVNGEEWTAYSEDSLNVDDNAKIVGIDSIKLIIEKEE